MRWRRMVCRPSLTYFQSPGCDGQQDCSGCCRQLEALQGKVKLSQHPDIRPRLESMKEEISKYNAITSGITGFYRTPPTLMSHLRMICQSLTTTNAY